jgi:chorismate mutase
MNIQPIFPSKKRPVLIAGPCSAETEEQVLEAARQLSRQSIDLFRAGIWKPRTRPDSFEGVGAKGLPWLSKVREEFGLKVTTEVANARHVYESLKHRIDVLWIGARTTVNPFAVQEIADALQGVDVPVLIKNPINPDLKLWIGAIERIHKAGISKIAVIHRGFSYHGNTQYRNIPRWQIPIELKRQFPQLEIICDNSHICGRRDTLQAVAQQALDLRFDGLMTEVHPTPDAAWSDAQQQITPDVYRILTDALVLRKGQVDDPDFNTRLAQIRQQIDELDEELLHLLGSRMQLAEQIGQIKLENEIAILQTDRWNEILEKGEAKGASLGLSGMFVRTLLKAIHQESINHQEQVMTEQSARITSEK